MITLWKKHEFDGIGVEIYNSFKLKLTQMKAHNYLAFNIVLIYYHDYVSVVYMYLVSDVGFETHVQNTQW